MPSLSWHSHNQFPHCKMGLNLVSFEAVGPAEPVVNSIWKPLTMAASMGMGLLTILQHM